MAFRYKTICVKVHSLGESKANLRFELDAERVRF